MILVVVGHANYLVFGVPSKTDILYDPTMTSFRIVVYQLCVIAVNCFVFISGWFKIKPNIKKGAMLLFQSLEYGLGIALLFYLLGYSVPKIFFVRLFFIGEYFWFIIAYLQLFILSPILNAFSENASPRHFKIVVSSFFIFEFVFGWIGGEGNYHDGYSAIHFVGLYLLAQYLRNHVCLGLFTFRKSLALYLIPVILVAFFFGLMGPSLSEKWFYTLMRYMKAYNSPLVLCSSVGFFFMFYSIKIESRLINWMSTSVLAIYLIHLHPYFYQIVFEPLIIKFSSNVIFLSITILVICFFCLLIDKIRMMIQMFLVKLFFINK